MAVFALTAQNERAVAVMNRTKHFLVAGKWQPAEEKT